ncbi:MAG: ATP-dependent Clp protease proteolytic subunit [Patescibacteria group bacterium]
MDYYINFQGVIDQESSLKLTNAILKAPKINAKKIHLFFSSLGGSIYDGFLLASIIRNSKVPITIHATNHVDSIANVVYLSSKERTAESYAKFYVHGASVQGNFDAKALEDKLTEIKTNNIRIAYFVSENCSLKLKEIQKMMETGTTISAQEAFKKDIVTLIMKREIPLDALQEDIIYVN